MQLHLRLHVYFYAVGSEMRLEKDKTNLQMIVDHELKDVYVHVSAYVQCSYTLYIHMHVLGHVHVYVWMYKLNIGIIYT